MARYFLDTSALEKYYHNELGSEKVLALFSESGRNIRISDLGVVEAQSAFAMRVRAGQLDQEGAGAQRAIMMLDIAAGAVEVHKMRPDHFRTAGLLIGRHGYYRRLRTLDALQLAMALELSQQGLLDMFVVADKALCEVAALEGIRTLNPEVS